MQVAVVGPGDAGPPLLELAYDVGRRLASAGAVVVTGGLGGVMDAASRGAASAGGLVLALLPGDDRAAATPAAAVVLPTGMGEARNVLVVRAADGVVSVGGSWGTLSEVALALRTGRPVVSLAGWSVLGPGGEPVPGGPLAAGDAEEAVRRVLAAVPSTGRADGRDGCTAEGNEFCVAAPHELADESP